MAKILIVDDEEWNVSHLIGLIERSQPLEPVDYASSVSDAVGYLFDSMKNRPYDALISDYNMDSINGQQFLGLLNNKLIYLLSSEGIDYCIENFVKDKKIRSFSNLVKILREDHIIDNEIKSFFEDHFTLSKYRALLRYCTKNTLKKTIFSGSYFKKSQRIMGVNYFQKDINLDMMDPDIDDKPVKKQHSCESDLLYRLCEQGILDEEKVNDVINGKPRYGDEFEEQEYIEHDEFEEQEIENHVGNIWADKDF